LVSRGYPDSRHPSVLVFWFALGLGLAACGGDGADTTDTTGSDSSGAETTDTGETMDTGGETTGDTTGGECLCDGPFDKPFVTDDGACHCGLACDVCPDEGCSGLERLCESRCCGVTDPDRGIGVCILEKYCGGPKPCTCPDGQLSFVTAIDGKCHCGAACDPCGEQCSAYDRLCATRCCATQIDGPEGGASVCIPSVYCNLADKPVCRYTCETVNDCVNAPDSAGPGLANTCRTGACACVSGADCPLPEGHLYRACDDDGFGPRCFTGDCLNTADCPGNSPFVRPVNICRPLGNTGFGLCVKACETDDDCCENGTCATDPNRDTVLCQQGGCVPRRTVATCDNATDCTAAPSDTGDTRFVCE